jgi:DNA polymerase
MKTISIDIETFSGNDLSKCGVYKYCEAPDFEILLFGYAIDSGTVNVVDIANGEAIPPQVLDALTDDTVQKWAFNANFERICLSRYLRDMGLSLDPFADNQASSQYLGIAKYLNPESWRCSMVWSAYMGLPLSLVGAGAVLGLEKQKLAEGKELIRYFCSPCKPTAANGLRTRNLPQHAPDKWAAFKLYNKRDVEAEMSVQERLTKFPVPDSVWSEYCQDQEINDRGVMLDMTLVRRAIEVDTHSKAELKRLMRELTELDNPNSVTQMKLWLCENGLETDTLGKKAVAELLKTAPEPLGKALSLRQQLAKSSVKKYQTMGNAVCTDGRARGMFQFYGANRTGRWAGRLIQMQNLPQNHLPDLEQARSLVRGGNIAALELLYDSIPEVLSELIRTAFIPKEGKKFVVADFSAIEARVIAWLARESWRNEVFASHGKIYEASASQMFKIPIAEITKGSPLRQKGKIAELALGYGGSVGALKAMGALDIGLSEEELQPLVTAWRAANPNIVRLWWDVDHAAMKAVRDRTLTETHDISCRPSMGGSADLL